MTSQSIRDPIQDHLLTPQNSALIIIDYQPIQVTSVASMDRRALVDNIVSVAKIAKLYKLPVVLSTVNVKTGANQPTIHQLQELFPGVEPLDRTTINAWEDVEFLKAVKATGRKNSSWRPCGWRRVSPFRRLMQCRKATRFTPSSMR